jgi:hypothetical protein
VRSTADQERAARSAQSYQVVTGWSDRWILLSLHVAAVVNDIMFFYEQNDRVSFYLDYPI